MLTALVVGNMIGGGSYSLPSFIARLGSIGFLGYRVATFGVFCMACVLIDLNKRLPVTEGPYVFSRTALGDFIGFLVTYYFWLAFSIGIAAMMLTLIGYLDHFWSIFNEKSSDYSPLLAFLVKLGIIWLGVFMNVSGVRTVSWVQLITTALKIIPIIIIPILSFKVFSLEKFDSI